MEKRRVLITGLGTVNPHGPQRRRHLGRLSGTGVCGIGPITRYDCSAPEGPPGRRGQGLGPRLPCWTRRMCGKHEPLHPVGHAAAAKEALADSGLIPEAEDPHPLRRHRLQRHRRHRRWPRARNSKRCWQKGFDRVSPFYIPTTIANMARRLHCHHGAAFRACAPAR